MKQEIQHQSNLQWAQWQLLDSVLPTGGFAHSLGLETAIQAQIVVDYGSLKAYIKNTLHNAGSFLLPFVYGMNRYPDLDQFLKLDSILEAMMTNEVSRKASSSQGSALLRVAASVFPDNSIVRKIRGIGGQFFHHGVVFGLISGVVGFDGEAAQRAFLFLVVRDLVSAATRLNLIGPLGAASLQHEMGRIGEEVLRRWMNKPVEEACQSVPVLDTVQGCHGYLFSRMFCS